MPVMANARCSYNVLALDKIERLLFMSIISWCSRTKSSFNIWFKNRGSPWGKKVSYTMVCFMSLLTCFGSVDFVLTNYVMASYCGTQTCIPHSKYYFCYFWFENFITKFFHIGSDHRCKSWQES